MKLGKMQRFFKKKNKKDFFSELWGQIVLIAKDILLVYRNFIHWSKSKVIINLSALLTWVVFALPFLLFSLFVWLIDPIPWATFIASQINGVSPILEALSYLSLHPFSFVIMTLAMILTLIAFLIWNAYANVLYVRLYDSYISGEKLHFRENIYLSRPHMRRFIAIALWNLVYLMVPAIIILILILWTVILHSSGSLSFEAFSLTLLAIVLVSVFVFSYILYRLLFAVILLAQDSTKKAAKHSWIHYIKKSLSLTSWWKKYIKFLWVLSIMFLVISPFRSIGETLANDLQNIWKTIEYRALVIADPERAEQSNLREVAELYDLMTDETLFANYRGAKLLNFIWSFIWFFVFSWLYTMLFVSFYTRVLR